jgi:hypothetical protein
MVMVEEYPCENKLESFQKEIFWRKELNATLNKVVPGRTTQE